MKNKTEALRLAYNKIATEYDSSKEGRYTQSMQFIVDYSIYNLSQLHKYLLKFQQKQS